MEANKLIKDYLNDKQHGHYLDVATVIYKPGTSVPDSSLFKSDYLHLNSKGYDKWQKVLVPYVN